MHFHSWKSIWKCYLENGGLFFSASMSKWSWHCSLHVLKDQYNCWHIQGGRGDRPTLILYTNNAELVRLLCCSLNWTNCWTKNRIACQSISRWTSTLVTGHLRRDNAHVTSLQCSGSRTAVCPYYNTDTIYVYCKTIFEVVFKVFCIDWFWHEDYIGVKKLWYGIPFVLLYASINIFIWTW